MGIPEENENTEGIFETNIENFPKLMSKTKPNMQKAQRTQSRINGPPKKTTSAYTIFKLQKIKRKEKNLKEAREKKATLPVQEQIRIISDFSETTHAK